MSRFARYSVLQAKAETTYGTYNAPGDSDVVFCSRPESTPLEINMVTRERAQPYLGNMEKIGSYTGGTVMSGNAFRETYAGNGTISYRSWEHAYLFSSYQGFWTSDVAGGVLVTHADNPTPWRAFRRGNAYNDAYNIPTSCVLGGFQDNINDAYLARGKALYAGLNILVPINLYAARPSNNISAIGRPPGVRMVHMEDLAPEADIQVADKNWRVFPQFAKESSGLGTYSNGFIVSESSYYAGLAYLKD